VRRRRVSRWLTALHPRARRKSEDSFFGFELGVFARAQCGVADFLALEGPQVEHPQTVLLTLLECGEFFARTLPRGVCRSSRFRRQAGEAVEQQALLRRVEATLAFTLRVNQREFRRELTQDGDGGGLIVDEDAPLAVGVDFAAQDNFSALRIDAVGFQNKLGAGRRFKHAGHHGALGAVTHHIRRRLLTQKQGERVYQ
jgi:hypothetical protein